MSHLNHVFLPAFNLMPRRRNGHGCRAPNRGNEFRMTPTYVHRGYELLLQVEDGRVKRLFGEGMAGPAA